MKVFKMISILMVFSMFILSCDRDSYDSKTNEDITYAKNHISTDLQLKNQNYNNISFFYQEKRYNLLKDNSLAYYNKNNVYVGDLIVKDLDAIVENNLDDKGFIKVINKFTGEDFVIKNIREMKDQTLFDVYTNTGMEFFDIQISSTHETSSMYMRAVPIVPVIRGIVAVVSIIAVTVSSGGTQEDCVNALPTDCPEGYAPYAEYESGWFVSSCKVGCRK